MKYPWLQTTSDWNGVGNEQQETYSYTCAQSELTYRINRVHRELRYFTHDLVKDLPKTKATLFKSWAWTADMEDDISRRVLVALYRVEGIHADLPRVNMNLETNSQAWLEITVRGVARVDSRLGEEWTYYPPSSESKNFTFILNEQFTVYGNTNLMIGDIYATKNH